MFRRWIRPSPLPGFLPALGWTSTLLFLLLAVPLLACVIKAASLSATDFLAAAWSARARAAYLLTFGAALAAAGLGPAEGAPWSAPAGPVELRLAVCTAAGGGDRRAEVPAVPG